MSYNRKTLFYLMLRMKLRVKEEDLRRAILLFKKKFRDKPDSWVRRCIKRLVDISATSKPDTWIVRGRPSMGDYEAFYIVTLHRREGKYNCTCYDPKKPFGYRRMKNICTHVGTVILWRLVKEKLIYDFMHCK